MSTPPVAPKHRRATVAASLTAVLMMAVMAVALTPSTPPPPEAATHLSVFLDGHLFNSSHQRLAHLLLLVLGGLLFIIGPAPLRLPAAWTNHTWKVGVVGLFAAQLVAGFTMPQVGMLTVLGGLTWMLHSRGSLLSDPRVALAGFGPLFAWFYLTPLIAPYDLSFSTTLPWYFDLHYAAVLEAGHRATAGQALYEQVPVFYGGGLTGVVAVVDNVLGPPSAARDVQMVVASQVVAAALFAAAVWMTPRRDGLFWGLFAVIVAFPAASNATVMPNLSGLRFFGMAVAALLFRCLHLCPERWRALALGAVAGLAVAWNPETGFAVIGGGVTWIVVRHGLGDLGAVLRGIVTFVVGFAVSITTLGLSGPMVLGFSLFPDIENLLFFATGNFGNPPYAAPVIVAAAAHATYVLVWRALSRKASSPRAAGRAAIAGMLLVWLAYFANRPTPTYELTYMMLWALLVVDAWPMVSRTQNEIGRATQSIAFLVLLPALCVAAFTHSGSSYVRCATALHGPMDADAQMVSGMWLPGDVARGLKAQAGAVQPDDTVWVPAAGYFIHRLVGRYPDVRPSSPFGDTRSHEELQQLKNALAQAPRVLLQAPDQPGLNPKMRPFFEDLAKSLTSTHTEVAPRPGWRVFERSGSGL